MNNYSNNIDKLLSEMVEQTSRHFKLDYMKALEAVVESDVAERLTHDREYLKNDLDSICNDLFQEIATAS